MPNEGDRYGFGALQNAFVSRQDGQLATTLVSDDGCTEVKCRLRVAMTSLRSRELDSNPVSLKRAGVQS